jgi:hypothetical protein
MTKYEIYPVQIFYCIDCLEKDHMLIYHDDPNGNCPVCDAGPGRQAFALVDKDGSGVEDIDSDHPLALEMLHQTRMRTFRRAIYHAPLSTLEEMIIQLMEIRSFRADEHPEPQGVRSGLFGDKLKALQEIKGSLLINDKPEESIEVPDGPIY